MIFNPSFPYRLVHMVLAAYLTTAFVVGAVGALHLLRNRNNPGARLMFSMAMWMAVLVAPLQIAAGDAHGINTLQYQPAKIAAMEGHFDTHASQRCGIGADCLCHSLVFALTQCLPSVLAFKIDTVAIARYVALISTEIRTSQPKCPWGHR